MNNKLYNLQALRGIAVLFVLFYHMVGIEHKYNYLYSIIPHSFAVGYIGVDIFL
jgi:peptidoglycan/LPS O-acetylase OafA/YrhL